MYSSARAESLSFLWIVATRLSMVVASCTSDLAPEMPIEASVLKGFTNRGIRRLPPVSMSSGENTAKSGYLMSSKARTFLASPLSCRRYNSPGPPPV